MRRNRACDLYHRLRASDASGGRRGAARSLKAAVEEAGIAYRHFRDLGTPADGRAAARRGDHRELARVYSGQLELPQAMKQMAELRSLAEGGRVCLLCYERYAADCHRALLFDALLADFERVDLQPALVAN